MKQLRASCLLILLLAIACATPPTPPVADSGVDLPAIRGYVTSRTANSIVVEEDPRQTAGSSKAAVQLTPQTKVFMAGNREGSAGDLEVGQYVAVWFDGPVAQSYPVRGTARRVAVEERRASSGNGDRVVLSAEPRGSSSVVLALRNPTGSRIGYNLCSSSLQRRSGTEWEAVPTGEMCTMEIRELQSDGSATFEKTLPANITRGEYRYMTTVERPEGRVEVASNTFAVR